MNQSLAKENVIEFSFFFCMARQPYMGLSLLVSSRFHGHTHVRHTTVGRTPLYEGPARRRDLYLTTHNTQKGETSMPPVGYVFFACPGFFFPFDPFLYCLNPFVLHVTLRSMLPSLRQTQHKYPCPFELTILVSERPKTHALDRTATGIGMSLSYMFHFNSTSLLQVPQ
jgi:hypothetical protein